MASTTRRKRTRLALFTLFCCLVGAGIIGAVTVRNYLINRPIKPQYAFPHGEIRIGVDASFPPFAVDDGTSLWGLDIDLGKAIAEDIGMPVRFVNMGFDGLYDSVIADQVDMVISALQVDLTRTAEVRYTQHYFDAGLVLVTPEGSPITMMEFMQGYRIAYEFGSVADAEVRDWEKRIGRMQHRPYELPEYALDAVRLDHADAALVDNTSYRLYLRNHPNWETQRQRVTTEVYAIAIRIDRLNAWKLVNHALTTLKESGELATIIDKWL